MDFIDQIRELGERALDLKGALETEEATKNALVMPFIRLLGYDVFDPEKWFLNTLLILAPKRAKRLIMLFSKTDPLQFYLNARLQTLNLVAVTPANCIVTFQRFRRFGSECLQTVLCIVFFQILRLKI